MKYILAIRYKDKVIDDFISKELDVGLDITSIYRKLLIYLTDSNLYAVGFRADDNLGYRITDESGGEICSLRWPSDYELSNSS